MAEPAGTDRTGGCPDADDAALLHRWHSLYSGLRRVSDQLLADVETDVAVAPSSLQVLWFLLSVPDRAAPMSRLSQLLGFSTAGTTGVVDRLVDAGLLERRPSSSDRRVTFAALTTPGVEVAETASRALAQALRRRLVEPLGSERFEALVDAVGSLGPTVPSCGEGIAPSSC